ncbi:MAG TPA: hypothetical protein VMR70_18525 [Flavisolibacter sp.]|nr:hypothetical protein [Flavisolibacter sp.]
MRILVIAVLVLFVCACKQDKKFQEEAWNEKGDLGIYPNREKMLKDLMSHHQLIGLNYKQLIKLLGEPEKFSDKEPITATYNIVTDID